MLLIKSLQTPHIGPIDLTVGSGECAAIMGASGSGKSLMLRAIADLDLNSGHVALDGQNRDQMEATAWRKLVTYVPAESGWWYNRVGQHFSDCSESHSLLSDIGLPDAFDWEVSRLSTGQRQRLALCRSLLMKPSVLLLDEPTAALDQSATEDVENLLRKQISSGVRVVLVTHDQSQAERLGTQSFEMLDGRLRQREDEVV
ncbi:MAG: ABC transporter ATP-binding protein [Maritimibacter sp.]|jgi:ABC-type iron transport system FetAB ATPase subunit